MHSSAAARLAGIVSVASMLLACSSSPTNQGATRSAIDRSTTPALSRQDEYRLGIERNERFLACLRADGIETSEVPGGGVELGTGGLSDEAFEALREQCEAQAGPPVIPAPLTEEEARQQYRWNLETRQCLIEAGFTVVEPSSADQYVEDAVAGRAPWSAYDGIEDIPGAQVACPQRVLGQE